MKQFLETGEIVNTHGIRGEVKLLPWADAPEFILEFDELYIDGRAYAIESARVQKTCVLLKLEGVDTVEEAIKLRGKVVSVDRTDIELEEGSYFIADLIGLPVFAGFTGGAHRLFGPTGGFLLGYIPCAALTGLLAVKGGFWRRCAGMIPGVLCCYVLGTVWYALQSGAEIPTALAVCVLPFLPGDAAKLLAASALAALLQRRLGRFLK